MMELGNFCSTVPREDRSSIVAKKIIIIIERFF
jgi:hypothetical protein